MNRAAIGAAAFCGLLVLAARAGAEIMTQTIEYKQGGVTLKGYLAYDPQSRAFAAGAKRPGVLVAPEWWGLNDYAKRRARELAGLGYVAFALDPFGDGATATTPQKAMSLVSPLRSDRNLMRARARAALETLADQKMVDPKRLAAIGYCFGGSVVLELARGGADLVGVVCFHGTLDTPNPEDARNIKGSILVCNGADDSMVAGQIAGFESEMRAAHVDYVLINYGGAVHAFTNPDAGKAAMPGVAYNARADRRSWQAMKQFLREVFGQPAMDP
jgi:dienelactone hydrolase